MRSRNLVLVILAMSLGSLASACSGDSEKVAKLRDALGKAELSLSDSVTVAEAETIDGIGVRAALLVDADPVFSIGARATAAFQEVRVDIVTGKVLAVQAGGGSGEECSGAVSLNQAIASAENEVGGDAVAIEPDDDGHCNREVKVLDADTLWEVKVAPDGSIIEVEEDDEA